MRAIRLLSALCLGAGLSVGPAFADAPAIGKTAAVAPAALSQKPGSTAPAALAPGADLVAEERLVTDRDGRIDALFLDGSNLTVGGNSDILLDRFIYDPGSSAGDAAIAMAKGTLRIIGGKVTKSGAIAVEAPNATMAIRGGIALFHWSESGEGLAAFLYGRDLSIQTASGQRAVLSRPGFALRVTAAGALSEPFVLSAAELDGLLAALGGKGGQGASRAPDLDGVDLADVSFDVGAAPSSLPGEDFTAVVHDLLKSNLCATPPGFAADDCIPLSKPPGKPSLEPKNPKLWGN